MKINATRDPSPPKFVPVNVNITLESQAEIDALYAAGNWSVRLAELLAKSESAYSHHTVPVTVGAAHDVLARFYNALSGFESHRGSRDI